MGPKRREDGPSVLVKSSLGRSSQVQNPGILIVKNGVCLAQDLFACSQNAGLQTGLRLLPVDVDRPVGDEKMAINFHPYLGRECHEDRSWRADACVFHPKA